MNWALGYDTLHPLEGHIQSPPPPPPARPYIPKYSVENPSPYYLEQAPFYCDPTIPDPFEHQAEEPDLKRQFGAIFLTIFYFLSHATSSLFSAIVTTLSIILTILSFAFQRGVVGPMEGVQHFVANITVYGIGAFVVALYVAALLPSWKRTAVQVFEESEPLYRIFISGREALGNGPVTSSQL
ncbi:hypothetical protein BKA61DRAFT_571917 [Leptodontidium sp. MPI-SDFR-AT-0119]|nr:hypothetical protein BKA61DRAFT_571917 [Leptodontidium sp. MPI-SDFR-AT-0119]